MRTTEVTTPFGTFRCFEDQFTQDLRRYGAHQRSDLAVMRDVVEPGDLVVDVGAFIGTVAVPLAKAVGPRGHVVCFEPVEAHHELLLDNLRRNGVAGQVTAVNALVGATSETVDFEASAWSMSTATTAFRLSIERSEGGEEEPETLRMWRLDDWFMQNMPRRRPVRLLKVDVEGMELAVLQGASGIIETDRPVLEVEVGGGRDSSMAETAAFLRDHRYRLLVNVADRDSGSDAHRLGRLSYLPLLGDMLTDVVAVPAEDPLPLPLRAGWLQVHWTILSRRYRLAARLRRLGLLGRP